MPVDFTFLEPDGLQVHILVNDLLSKYGFFKNMSKEEKVEFDGKLENIIKNYLTYDEE